MKKTIYGALAAMILALGACAGSGGEAAEPAPTAPIADDTSAAGDTKAADDTRVAEDKAAEPATPAEPAAPAAPAAAPTDEDMEKAFELMQAMAKNATDTTGDCKAMAAGFEKVFADNADLIKKMNSMKDDAAMQAKWDAKYKAASEQLMMGMMGDIGECMKDPDLQAAMAKMSG